MIFIRHFKWGKHIRVDGDEPTNDEVAYAVGLLDPHYLPPSMCLENCIICGFPQSEHHYNGAAYGVCGKYRSATSWK